MKVRLITRKTGCKDCGNNCGSRHAKTCPWAYLPEPNSKARYKKRRLSLRAKIKAIIKIIKA